VLTYRTVKGSEGLNEGDLLFGKYRVERTIGSGGMGIVVAARHQQLDQLVAIKFIGEHALGHADAALRFLREARAAAKLKSEYVTRVLDVGILESGAPYMIMEYLEGSDLAKVIAQFGPMPPTYALRLFRQACAALAEAHAAGIVHRDLKPQNLFLTHTTNGSPRLKVLDFGISKSSETGSSKAGHALTSASAVLGSPLYMAPEQMQSSRDVDARADVWSLGVVLFELLTGRCPFDADTYAALCVKIATSMPCRLSDFRQDVPPEVVTIIDRCLERDVARRFANAAEVAEALDALAPDILPPSDAHGRAGRSALSLRVPDALRSSESTPPGWASHGNRRATRNGALAVRALLLIGAVLAVGFVIARRWGPWHSTSAVQVSPPVAANPVLAPHSAPSDGVPPSSEVATQPMPPTTVPTKPSESSLPGQRALAAPRGSNPWLAPTSAVDSEGIPGRTAPSKQSALRSPPRAAAAVPAAANAPADDGIPSRR
jgi:eukaryotic-like serine/threonine-protein kinase